MNMAAEMKKIPQHPRDMPMRKRRIIIPLRSVKAALTAATSIAWVSAGRMPLIENAGRERISEMNDA
jgi:hypothetical protein